MLKVYETSRERRKEYGLIGREWIQKEEVGMTTEAMCSNFVKHVDELLENWEPIDRYSVIELDGNESLKYTEIPDYLFKKN